MFFPFLTIIWNGHKSVRAHEGTKMCFPRNEAPTFTVSSGKLVDFFLFNATEIANFAEPSFSCRVKHFVFFLVHCPGEDSVYTGCVSSLTGYSYEAGKETYKIQNSCSCPL